MENDLVGKIAEVLFETGYHYKLEYLPKNKLRWTSLKEEDYGKTEIEDVQIHKINDGQYSVNWVESTGINVNHILDVNSRKVWAYMNWNNVNFYGGRESLVHEGVYQFINNDRSDDDTPFTNLEKAKDFWNRFFNQKDLTAIDDYLALPYIQHNPYITDGIEVFKEYFVQAFKEHLKESNYEIKSITSSGALVYIHNLKKNNSKELGSAGMDIFRFENGKIVEHWDIIQEMPQNNLNPHPMF